MKLLKLSELCQGLKFISLQPQKATLCPPMRYWQSDVSRRRELWTDCWCRAAFRFLNPRRRGWRCALCYHFRAEQAGVLMAAKEWGRCSVRRSGLSVVGVAVPSRSPGWVYVLTNPAIPGRVKIGCTSRTPEIRAAELSKASAVPEPFAVAWAAAVTEIKRQAAAQLRPWWLSALLSIGRPAPARSRRRRSRRSSVGRCARLSALRFAVVLLLALLKPDVARAASCILCECSNSGRREPTCRRSQSSAVVLANGAASCSD